MTDGNELPVKPAPATGAAIVDAEHGIQLGLLDAALSSFEPQAKGDSLELVDQLHGYTQTHFMSEQLLMRLAPRANYDAHLQDHELLMKELDEARALLERGEFEEARDRLQSHHTHLLDHIRSWDRSIAS